MHFSSDINRPPYEAADMYLQVTKGCSHGARGGCDFCTFYKNCAFEPSPWEEIEADVQELRLIGRRYPFDRIFLQGANSLVLPYRLFAEATEAERFEELRELVSLIQVETVFKAEHVTLPEPVRGRLPRDRGRLLAQLDRLVDDARAGKLDHFRATVMGL